jgi:uncharacterized protein (TIGR02145 family)
MKQINLIIMALGLVCISEEAVYSQTIADIDGNLYNTVMIGTQNWMKENLKTTKYNDGSEIPYIKADSIWSSFTMGAYCDFDNKPTISEIYGRLYNWYVVTLTNPKNVCPSGWHVPTDEEWTILTFYLGDGHVAGGKMKEKGTAHWIRPNIGATNETGFTALPGGGRLYSGAFGSLGEGGFWWSSTERDSQLALFTGIANADSSVSNNSGFKNCGFSIRCMKNK